MLLTQDIINRLSKEAKVSPRLRINYNLHESFEDSVPIARHPYSSEILIMLRGKLRVLICDDNKNILKDVIIEANTDNIGYHIPKGTWHQVESLECDTVCFETREGPYIPVAECDMLK